MPIDPYVCVDGRYRFVCESGHHVVTNQRNPDHCTAPTTGGLCGSEFSYREVDYLGPDIERRATGGKP